MKREPRLFLVYLPTSQYNIDIVRKNYNFITNDKLFNNIDKDFILSVFVTDAV